MNEFVFFPVIMELFLPAGILGPDPTSYDVRAFLLPREGGVTLIDTGYDADAAAIADALTEIGANWGDVSDVILTHGHVDHIGGLETVTANAPSATVWAGPGDTFPTPVRRVGDGDVIRGLRVLSTPGHTPGHLSLFEDTHKVLFVGDVVGNMHGQLVLAPAQFTDDAQESLRSLRRLSAQRFDRLILSHGDELPDPAATLTALINSVDNPD
ncbi:MAG: MBL fold metallo-hydrolase [Propionibacteriaceae bacterium]|nr:MBL fold metallo-hydrolase [Propionibacteriaceae bacterium]